MLITDPVYEFTISKDTDSVFSFHFRPGQTWTINCKGVLSEEPESFSVEQLTEFMEESVRFTVGSKPDLKTLGSHCFLFPNGTVCRFIHETQDILMLDMFLPVADLKALNGFKRAE